MQNLYNLSASSLFLAFLEEEGMDLIPNRMLKIYLLTLAIGIIVAHFTIYVICSDRATANYWKNNHTIEKQQKN